MKLNVPFVSSTTTFAFNQYSSKIMKPDIRQLFSLIFSMGKSKKFLKMLQDKGYPAKNVISIVQNDNDTHTIVYTSPEFQPCAKTFSHRYVFVGPSIQELDYPVTKPEQKTIYISLGTVNNQSTEFFKNCIQAFKDSSLQVIMSVGNIVEQKDLGEIPDNFTVAPSVNQIEVLQKVDAFLTHCGMNSVNEALYYQVPLVLFPQTNEQSGVANRVAELGAGLFLKESSPQGIQQAIQEVLNNSSYRTQAEKISQSFHRCGGVNQAVEKILSVTGSK